MILKRPFYYEYAWAYDLLIDAKTEKRIRFIKQIIKEYNHAGVIKILDAGCGSGSLSLALASEGFEMTGMDLSEALIDEAIKRDHENINPHFEVENILSSDYTNIFDIIICRGVLNDFIEDTERSDIFKIFYKALKKNGMLIADVREWEETKKRKLLLPVQEKKVETEKGLLTFISETNLNDSDKTLNIKETHLLVQDGNKICSENFFIMKCWTLREIIQYSKNTKFSVEKLFSDYDSSAKIGQTDRIVFVLRK